MRKRKPKPLLKVTFGKWRVTTVIFINKLYILVFIHVIICDIFDSSMYNALEQFKAGELKAVNFPSFNLRERLRPL